MMFYVAVVTIMIVAIRTMSFAIYNWKSKNIMAFVGSITAVLLATVFPMVLTFLRR